MTVYVTIYVLYVSKNSSLSSLLKFLLTIPITDRALAADLRYLRTVGFKSSASVYIQVFLFGYSSYSTAISGISSVSCHEVISTWTVTNVHDFAFTGVEL